ncbi:hypothetical protein HK102_008893, partial [Quaeritorhiza haematococci]
MLTKLEGDLKSWFDITHNLEEEEELMRKLHAVAVGSNHGSNTNTTHPHHRNQPQHPPELTSLIRKVGFYIMYHACRIALHRCNMLLLMRHAPLLAALDVEEFGGVWERVKETWRRREENTLSTEDSETGQSYLPFSVESLPLSVNKPGTGDRNYVIWAESLVTTSTPNSTASSINPLDGVYTGGPERVRKVLGVLRRSCITTMHAAERIAVVLGWLGRMLAGAGAPNPKGNANAREGVQGQASAGRVGAGVGAVEAEQGQGGGGVGKEGGPERPGGAGIGAPGAPEVAAMVLSAFPECALFDAAVVQLLVGVLARGYAGYLSRRAEHDSEEAGEKVAPCMESSSRERYEKAVEKVQIARRDYGIAIKVLQTMMMFWRVAVNMIDAAGVLDGMTGGAGAEARSSSGHGTQDGREASSTSPSRFDVGTVVGDAGDGGGSGSAHGVWHIEEAHVFWRFLKTFRGYFLAGEREYPLAPSFPMKPDSGSSSSLSASMSASAGGLAQATQAQATQAQASFVRSAAVGGMTGSVPDFIGAGAGESVAMETSTTTGGMMATSGTEIGSSSHDARGVVSADCVHLGPTTASSLSSSLSLPVQSDESHSQTAQSTSSSSLALLSSISPNASAPPSTTTTSITNIQLTNPFFASTPISIPTTSMPITSAPSIQPWHSDPTQQNHAPHPTLSSSEFNSFARGGMMRRSGGANVGGAG